MDTSTITALAFLIGAIVALLAELRRWLKPPMNKGRPPSRRRPRTPTSEP
jgi:hypothetical protein